MAGADDNNLLNMLSFASRSHGNVLFTMIRESRPTQYSCQYLLVSNRHNMGKYIWTIRFIGTQDIVESRKTSSSKDGRTRELSSNVVYNDHSQMMHGRQYLKITQLNRYYLEYLIISSIIQQSVFFLSVLHPVYFKYNIFPSRCLWIISQYYEYFRCRVIVQVDTKHF